MFQETFWSVIVPMVLNRKCIADKLTKVDTDLQIFDMLKGICIPIDLVRLSIAFLLFTEAQHRGKQQMPTILLDSEEIL